MQPRPLGIFSKAWLLLAIVLIYPFDSYAEDSIPVIIVSSDKIVEDDISLMKEVIDLSKDSQPGRTVADAIEALSGIKVKRYGGAGGFSAAYMRGMAPNRISIYVDGIPITGAYSDVVNLSDIPVGMIDKIEIYKSLTPSSLPFAGLGGGINIITRKPKQKDFFSELTARLGSFGSRGFALNVNKGLGILSLNGMIEMSKQKGDFEFISENGTRFNKNDDFRNKRKNNESGYLDFILSGKIDLDKYNLNLKTELYSKDNQIAGLGYNQAKEASYHKDRYLNSIKLSSVHDDNNFDISLFNITENKRFKDPLAEVSIGGTTDNMTISDKLGLNLNFRSNSFVPGSYAVLGLSLVNEKLRRINKFQESFYPKSNHRTRIEASLLLEKNFERASIIPSIKSVIVRDREDGSGKAFNFLNKRLGFIYRFNNELRFLCSISETFRPPSFIELFGEPYVINPSLDLRRERSINTEAGLSLSRSYGIRSFRADISIFNTISEDLITYIRNSQETLKAINFEKAVNLGIEFDAAIKNILPGFSISTNYTYQNPRNKGKIRYYQNKQVPDIPSHKFFLSSEYNVYNFEFLYQFDMVNNLFLTPVNDRKIDTNSYHSVGINYNISKLNMKIKFKVDNLFNSKKSEGLGYPESGREYGLTVSINH